MPKDISSSSEDEANSPAAESVAKRKDTEEKTTRYRCPADYVSFSHVPCRSTLTSKLKKNDNELWLIKAPVSFDPECFRNIKVPLSGLHTLKVPSAAGGAATGGVQQIYSVLASSGCTSDMRLLTSDEQSSDKAVFAPTFSGMLNVCESYGGGGGGADRPPQVIPAAPAPSIPPGLKQRFHPFGSKAPAWAAESETDGAALEPPSAAKRFIEDVWHDEEQDEEEEGRKKKKKKKKDKRIKTEDTEQTVEVKVEPGAEGEEEMVVERYFQEDDHSEEKRKKKKKKKDKEREVEEGPEPGVKVEEITVKPEPIDTSYSDAAEDSGKKKKKKKKSKTGDN